MNKPDTPVADDLFTFRYDTVPGSRLKWRGIRRPHWVDKGQPERDRQEPVQVKRIARGASVPQIGEDGQHPAMLVAGAFQTELAEDVGNVLFNGAVPDEELSGDSGV
jgi:hypothetical protein